MKINKLLKMGLMIGTLLSTMSYGNSSKECQIALKKTEGLYSTALSKLKLEPRQSVFANTISAAENGKIVCFDSNIDDKIIIDRLLVIIELSYLGIRGISIPDVEDIDTYQEMRKTLMAKKIAKVKASYRKSPLTNEEKQKLLERLKKDIDCGNYFFQMKNSLDLLAKMKSTPSYEITKLVQEARYGCKTLDTQLILLDIKTGEKLPELAWTKAMHKATGERLSSSHTVGSKVSKEENMAKQLCKNYSKTLVGFSCKCNKTHINLPTFGKYGGNFDLLTRDIMIGYFSEKQKLEAIVPTEGCEPHMYNGGGYAVYDKSETGSWKLQKYYSGKLKDCKKISFLNSKSKLVCSSHFFAQGYDENRLYIAKLTKDGIKSIDTLYKGTSNEGTGSKKQYNTTISKWWIEKENVIFVVNGKRKSMSLKKYENK